MQPRIRRMSRITPVAQLGEFDELATSPASAIRRSTASSFWAACTAATINARDPPAGSGDHLGLEPS
jgi:hypothetical protein